MIASAEKKFTELVGGACAGEPVGKNFGSVDRQTSSGTLLLEP